MEIVFRIARNLFYLYYHRVVGPPFVLLDEATGGEALPEWAEPAFKLGLTLLFLLILREIYVRVSKALVKRRLEKSMTGHVVREPHTARDTSFVEELDMAQHPVHTLAQLKKEKRYGRMADIYAKLNQPAEAARWYIKDRQHQRAAEELAKSGKTAQAARMLLRVGDYRTAARFYTSMGKHKKAADAYMKAGDLPGAATAWAEAGQPQKGAECFLASFASADEPADKKEAAADQCYRLLQDSAFTAAITPDTHKRLSDQVARRFLANGRLALAEPLFRQAGNEKLAQEVQERLRRAQTKGLGKTP